MHYWNYVMKYVKVLDPCGCCEVKLMGSEEIIKYERCVEHYMPEDDALILKAAKNERKYRSGIY